MPGDELPDAAPSGARFPIMTRPTPPRKGGPWEPAEDRYLLSMVDDGIPWPEIAEALKRPRGGCITRAGELLLAQLIDDAPDASELDSLEGAGRETSAWDIEEEGRLMASVIDGKSWDTIGLELQRQPTTCRQRAQVVALNQYLADLKAGTPTDASLRAASWQLDI